MAALAAFLIIDNSRVLVPDMLDTYGESAIVCRGPTDAGCAAEAARRARLPVAWTTPETAESYTMAVPKEGLAAQELKTPDYLLSIISGMSELPRGKRVSKFEKGSVKADVFIEDANESGHWGMSIFWTANGGVHYLIFVTNTRADVAAALNFGRHVFASIVYSSP